MNEEMKKTQKNSSKKSRKKKIPKIIYVWILLIVIIVLLLLTKNKQPNLVSNNITKSNKSNNTGEAQAYVEKNYLDRDVLPYIMDMLTEDDKVRLATVYVNKENGSRLKEIPLEKVKDKYEYLFGEELEIENIGLILTTGYIYKMEEKKFDTLEDYQENSENIEMQEKHEIIDKIIVTDCKVGSKNGEYIVTIKQISPKPAIEFVNYAENHSDSKFDVNKLSKMAGMILEEEATSKNEDSNVLAETEIENEEQIVIQEDREYLMSLINESNEEELTRVDYTLNLTVKEHDGRFVIVDREVKY